ncbi:MAG: 2OG-Fe(II) oxygenase family protein [Acidimicrobiales bacterium]
MARRRAIISARGESYLDEMVALSQRLDEAFAELLGLPNLAARSRNGPDAMACLRYQRGDDERSAAPNQQRMGAHSDYTSFTILNTDAVAGLQILSGGAWLGVEPVEGAPLLNVGDLFAMWTNDVWPSTLHRVPLRGDGSDAALRRSVAYFHYTDLDVAVAPLDDRTVGPPRYEPVTVRDHLAAKLVGPKIGRKSQGAITLGDRTLEQIDNPD